MRQVSVLALMAVLAGACPGRATAGPLSDTLKLRQTKLDELLAGGDSKLSAKARGEIAEALSDILDFPAMAEAALGEEWAKHSEGERKDFVAAFERLVRATNLGRLELYRTPTVDYLDETVEGEKGSVRTSIKSRDTITEVTYSFHQVGGRWRVVDYTIDGGSAMRNYRAQFGKILEKYGWTGLVERLRKRAAELEAAA